ncbi:MAG TPA: PQQ-dependent sugar dehydrogenase [Solirubrobacterales bacterium]|nr:PQQ-dependent sugar dehydrogenase [Solirubrobacterales bacterium]
MIRWVGTLATVLFLLGAASAQALTPQLVGNFAEPIFVTSAPANPDRLFVVERQGRIVTAQNGTLSVFADIRSVVGCEGDCDGERGLLSIALAPDFETTGRLFAFYAVDEAGGAIHVAEMTATGGFAPASSLRDVLVIGHPTDPNHYGGQLQFGPEGNLFVSTGDGGGSDDVHETAQDLTSPLGKLLRIDPDPSGLLPYTVPAGNPFAASPPADPTVWSYGLRNPFRFSFDRASGDLWIGDVGQDLREEVDFAAAPGLGAGANYGWNCREGRLVETVTPEAGCAAATSFVDPVFDYPHADPGGGGAFGCAIVGGYVARGPGLGDLAGRYLYGDNCTGDLRSFSPAAPDATDRAEGVHVGGLYSLGEDSCGRLYAVSGSGPVYRLVGPEAGTCPNTSPLSPALTPSFVGIRAFNRNKVLRNRRALITAWVAPCKGRRGDPVTLWRGRRKLGTRRLDRVCSVRFRPRINRRSRFRAVVAASDTYASATSRKLTIKPRRHRR